MTIIVITVIILIVIANTVVVVIIVVIIIILTYNIIAKFLYRVTHYKDCNSKRFQILLCTNYICNYNLPQNQTYIFLISLLQYLKHMQVMVIKIEKIQYYFSQHYSQCCHHWPQGQCYCHQHRSFCSFWHYSQYYYCQHYSFPQFKEKVNI